MKKLIVFEMDGTLAPSKEAIDPEMGGLLGQLLSVAKVAVISGGDWPQFQSQLFAHLTTDDRLRNLSILPTSGTKFFHYDRAWTKLCEQDFSEVDRKKILAAFQRAIDQAEDPPPKLWGDVVQDRGSQITFSALGQQAPIEAKEKWDPDFAKRKKIAEILQPLIPEFSIRIGGSTSIVVTQPKIDIPTESKSSAKC
jgi:phosphomannomutase